MPGGRPRKNAAGAAAFAPAATHGRADNRPQVPFAYKLVLNQWLLSLFNVKRFEDLAEHLRSEALEGLDANNVHHFHHALTAQLFNLTQLPTELLLEYDQNIVRHPGRRRRPPPRRVCDGVVSEYKPDGRHDAPDREGGTGCRLGSRKVN
jgi:hypothetical protein